jgi:hypothetical protein
MDSRKILGHGNIQWATSHDHHNDGSRGIAHNCFNQLVLQAGQRDLGAVVAFAFNGLINAHNKDHSISGGSDTGSVWRQREQPMSKLSMPR